jgi:hypothetical protein
VAQINLGQELGQRTSTTQAGVPSVAGLGQVAESMSNFLQTGADVVVEAERNRQNIQTEKAVADAVKEIENKAFEFETEDREYSTQSDRYNEFYTDMESRYQEQLGDPALFERWRSKVDPFAFKRGMRLKSNALKQNMEEQRGTLKNTLADLSGIAIRGDQEQFDDTVSQGEQLIDDAFESGIIDTAERDEEKRSFQNQLGRGKALQDINNDPAQALDNIRGNVYQGLSAEEQSQFEARAMSKLEQLKNRNKHELDKQSLELVSDTILALNQGQMVKEEEIVLARAAANRVEKEEDLEVAIASSQYITLPKDHRDQLLEGVQGVENAELRKALMAADETVRREVEKDGYAFAVKQRVIDEVPIDINDPSTVEARMEQMDYLEDHYGQPVSPLTDEEAQVFVNALPNLSPRQKTQLATAFGTSEEIWKQIDKKNAGLFAMTGAIGDTAVMENVFIGEQRLKDKTVMAPKQIDFLPVFNDHVGEVYVGRDRKQMIDAALAYYAGTTDSETFDTSDFEDAIEAVSGGIAKINGHKIELPRGVPEDDFEDYIDRISPATIQEFGGVWGVNDDQAVDLIKDGRIVSYATNQYMVIINDAVLMNGTNSTTPFLFSFDKEKFDRDQEIEPPRTTFRLF